MSALTALPAPGEIHLWRMSLVSETEPPWDNLSEADRARVGAFRREEDARRYCRTRVFLRQVISHYLGIDPGKIGFGQSKSGKPYLLNRPSLKFNLSHCTTEALLALTMDQEIGIDAEDVLPIPNLEQMAQDVLTPEEILAVLEADDQERLVRFLRAWTRKEAIVKAHGEGLGISLKSLSVPQQASGCWTVQEVKAEGERGQPVMVRDVSRDHVIAAIAGIDVSGCLVEWAFDLD